MRKRRWALSGAGLRGGPVAGRARHAELAEHREREREVEAAAELPATAEGADPAECNGAVDRYGSCEGRLTSAASSAGPPAALHAAAKAPSSCGW